MLTTGGCSSSDAQQQKRNGFQKHLKQNVFRVGLVRQVIPNYSYGNKLNTQFKQCIHI